MKLRGKKREKKNKEGQIEVCHSLSQSAVLQTLVTAEYIVSMVSMLSERRSRCEHTLSFCNQKYFQ